MGGWQEEVFVSLYQAAKLKEQQGYPDAEVLAAYAGGHRGPAERAPRRSMRASPLLPGEEAAMRRATTSPSRRSAWRRRTSALFAEPWVYDTGLLDEFADQRLLDRALWREPRCLPEAARVRQARLASRCRALPPMPASRATSCRGEGKAPNLGTAGATTYVTRPQARRTAVRRGPPASRHRACCSPSSQSRRSRPCRSISSASRSWTIRSRRSFSISAPTTTATTPRPILRDWVARVGKHYAAVEFDAADVAAARRRNSACTSGTPRASRCWATSAMSACGRRWNIDCDFYFVCDVDNFIRPCTLSELVDAEPAGRGPAAARRHRKRSLFELPRRHRCATATTRTATSISGS